MTSLGPLLLLWLLGRGHGGSQPSWPSRKSPPPRKASHARARAKPSSSTHAAATHAAATHPAAAQAAHAVHHAAAPDHAPHDHAMPVHTEHDSSEKGPDLTALNFGLRPAARRAAHHAPAEHAAAADTHTAEPPSPAEGQYSVANVQAILRALGWRGHLTTRGPLSPDLTDGLSPKYEDQPSVTRDDWQQSARKRGLDPTFIRVDSVTVHVDPETYATLRDVARSMGGNVVGIGRGRRIYIP